MRLLPLVVAAFLLPAATAAAQAPPPDERAAAQALADAAADRMRELGVSEEDAKVFEGDG